MTKAKKETPAKEFTLVRDFLSRYSALKDAEKDVVAVWAIGTHCFSPMCQWPATFPYLYITGEAGSGKTVLGQDVLGATARTWRSATGATGPTLFRMLGREDEETGEIENLAPTLCMDEIDATFGGSKDEPLRLSLNTGYKRGGTIPRSSGKVSIDFPIYGPKVMMGIDNGHLPETVTQRSIRIEVEKCTKDELTELNIQDFFIFDVEDEIPEIQEALARWAKDHSMVLRDYRPQPPKGLTARQWEIARTLVQLGKALGIEQRITDALVTVFGRKREKSNAKERLYAAILAAFEANPIGPGYDDRVTGRQIMAKLAEAGVVVPGQSQTGLSYVLAEDGISPQVIPLKEGHPGRINSKGKDVRTARGYMRSQFDRAFMKYLPHDDDE